MKKLTMRGMTLNEKENENQLILISEMLMCAELELWENIHAMHVEALFTEHEGPVPATTTIVQ